MSKKIFLAFIIALFVMTSVSAYAKDGTGSAERTTDETNVAEPTHKPEPSITGVKPSIRPGMHFTDEKENLNTLRADFKQKIATIKDEHKKAIVERVNTRLNEVNKNVTNRMKLLVQRFSDFLIRLNERITTAKENGKNTTQAENAIATAQSQLQTVNQAITAQAEKDYTIQISSESALKTDVTKEYNLLRTDLKTLYAQLILLKNDVVAAAKAVEALNPVTPEVHESISPSASSSSEVQQ